MFERQDRPHDDDVFMNTSGDHTSTDMTCCDGISFGGGTHLQIQRSSLSATRRPSGPVIGNRGPSH